MDNKNKKQEGSFLVVRIGTRQWTMARRELKDLQIAMHGSHDLASDVKKLEAYLTHLQRQQRAVLYVSYDKTVENALKWRKPRRAVKLPPGDMMLRFANVVFSKKLYDAVFEPLVNDYRYEYFEALSQNNRLKQQFVHMRHWWAFFRAVAAAVPVLSLMSSLWSRIVSK